MNHCSLTLDKIKHKFICGLVRSIYEIGFCVTVCANITYFQMNTKFLKENTLSD